MFYCLTYTTKALTIIVVKVFCIDVGNSSIKYGLVDGKHAVWTASLPTSHVTDYRSMVQRAEVADGIAWCSVVPEATRMLAEFIHEDRLASSKPCIHLNHKDHPGLEIDYPKPEEIGEDRLANAMAAQLLGGPPAVVIDMGTAVTFDVLTSKGYAGGIIAPGLRIMANYLHEQTALLPALNPNELLVSSGIGRSTLDAMKLGCAVGFQGMITALLDRVRKELKVQGEGEPKLYATGGSAGALAKDWAEGIQWLPDPTLIGLAEALRKKHLGL